MHRIPVRFILLVKISIRPRGVISNFLNKKGVYYAGLSVSCKEEAYFTFGYPTSDEEEEFDFAKEV